MDRGLVRKVDELGRVVIPKEMRRVLGISTGSSIEMFINGEDITLKKFSEIANIMDFAVKTADVIYEKFCLPVLVCDDEKILVAKGTKKNLEGQKFFVSSQSREVFVTKSTSVFKIEGDVTFDFTYIFPICIDGNVCGYIAVLSKENIDDKKDKIEILSSFLSKILGE